MARNKHRIPNITRLPRWQTESDMKDLSKVEPLSNSHGLIAQAQLAWSQIKEDAPKRRALPRRLGFGIKAHVESQYAHRFWWLQVGQALAFGKRTVAVILQDVLLRDVQISISKLADGAESGPNKNLTLRRLQKELRSAGEIDVADQMETLLDAFETASKAIKHRRNKWIAHSDLGTRLAARAEPLLGPSRAEIEAILAALRDVMNCVELEYTGATTAYEHFVMRHTGEHVINAFARAKRYEELVKAGQIPRDDFRARFPKGL